MLEFIVLILYPEKPIRITVTLANTIFGALSGVRQVSWGVVLQDLVGKLVSGLEKGKLSPINPYLSTSTVDLNVFERGKQLY